MEMSEHDKQVEELTLCLKKFNIPVETWGHGRFKSVRHLLEELECGEADLEEQTNGELLRILRSVTVLISYTTSEGTNLVLYEERQVFPDGTERSRDFLDGSVSGKYRKDEKPIDGARRELEEELGFDFGGELELLDTFDNTRISKSYPGLNSRYLLTQFGMDMPDEHFKPEGYVEVQDRITTYFKWREAA